MASYPITYRRRARSRRTLAAQGDDLAGKAIVDAASALGTRIGANYFCTRPNPDYTLCKAFNDAANRQAEKFRNSLLSLGVWGSVALLASLWERA
jgi:hypothetical protein